MGKEREKDCDQVFEAESPFPQVLCVYPSQWYSLKLGGGGLQIVSRKNGHPAAPVTSSPQCALRPHSPVSDATSPTWAPHMPQPGRLPIASSFLGLTAHFFFQPSAPQDKDPFFSLALC